MSPHGATLRLLAPIGLADQPLRFPDLGFFPFAPLG